tara:strand:+ start:2487 stop:4151 length:1665 start_codon:yes stop_codon:yes gene_type:complete
MQQCAVVNKIRQAVLMISILVGLGSCDIRSSSTEQKLVADWVIINGKILTVDNEFTVVEALAIKDSIILETGTTQEILLHTDNSTKVTNLKGKTVLPGLIDNHSHFVRAAKHWYKMVRWDDTYSRKEALSLMEKRSQILPKNEWVVVMGSFIFEQFKDNNSSFSLEELDSIFPDRPVFIQEGYSRAFVNTAALKASGFLNGSNSKYYKDIIANNGILNAGTQAFNIVFKAIPEPSTVVWDKSFSMATDSLLKMGLTTIVDMGGKTVTPDFYKVVERLVQKNELKIRFFYTLNPQNSTMTSPEEIQKQLYTNTPNLKDLQFAQFCFGETTYPPMRSSPFQVAEEDLEQFKKIIIAAVENDWQIHEHSLQELKVEKMLDVLEEVAEEYPKMKELRFTIAHTDGMSKESIQRAIDLEMVFAVHSTSRLMTKKQHEDGLMPPPASDINELGGLWGLGSDGTTVASPNPFHTIGWIVSGNNISGEHLMTQTVSREDALRAHTSNNAYLLFKENNLGSIEKGKRADIIVLNKDYMTVPKGEIKNLYSVMTIVDGRIMYEL